MQDIQPLPVRPGESRTPALQVLAEKRMNGGMPYLAVSISAEISAETGRSFLKEASKAVATGTGKPEQYVMVRLNAGQPLLFAGTDAPTAFLDLKSIGFPAHGVQGTGCFAMRTGGETPRPSRRAYLRGLHGCQGCDVGP